MTTDGVDLHQLVARLDALEHERAILTTMYAYGHSIDYGEHERWLDCFVDDGTFDIQVRDGVRRTYAGKDELRAFIVTHTFAPERWHKHLLIEPRIELDGDKATAVCYFTRLDLEEGGLVVHAFGRYLDRLEACTDGRWRFAERVVEVEAIDKPGPLLAG